MKWFVKKNYLWLYWNIFGKYSRINKEMKKKGILFAKNYEKSQKILPLKNWRIYKNIYSFFLILKYVYIESVIVENNFH